MNNFPCLEFKSEVKTKPAVASRKSGLSDLFSSSSANKSAGIYNFYSPSPTPPIGDRSGGKTKFKKFKRKNKEER